MTVLTGDWQAIDRRRVEKVVRNCRSSCTVLPHGALREMNLAGVDLRGVSVTLRDGRVLKLEDVLMRCDANEFRDIFEGRYTADDSTIFSDDESRQLLLTGVFRGLRMQSVHVFRHAVGDAPQAFSGGVEEPCNRYEDEIWQTVATRYVLEDRWLKLRADSCVTPDGALIEPYYVLEYRSWVNCLVIDSELNVVMVRHYRHGAGCFVDELISGGVEPHDDSPEVAIRRELKEEIGYVGGELYYLGESYPNPASQSNTVHSFMAYGGSCLEVPQREEGETLFVRRIPIESFVREIGEVKYQSMHLATTVLAFQHVLREGPDEVLRKILGNSPRQGPAS